jgi:predicted nucleic acid-binding protein
MNTIAIDTNVIISALLKEGITRKILLDYKFNFIFPEYGLKEIYFYRDYVIKKSGIKDSEFDVLMLRLFKYVKLVPLHIIKKFRKRADEIMKKIDKKDTVFIATSLAFKCPIWSDDRHFKLRKEIKVYNTQEFINLMLDKPR